MTAESLDNNSWEKLHVISSTQATAVWVSFQWPLGRLHRWPGQAISVETSTGGVKRSRVCAAGMASICGKTCLDSTASVDTGGSQMIPGGPDHPLTNLTCIGISECNQRCPLAGMSALLSRQFFPCHLTEAGLCPAPPPMHTDPPAQDWRHH